MTEQIYIVRAKVSYEVIDVSGPHENCMGVTASEAQAIELIHELINQSSLAKAKGSQKEDN